MQLDLIPLTFFFFFLKQVIIFYILAYTKHDSLILNAYLNKLLSVTSGSASSLLCGSLGEEVKMLSKESLRYTTPVIPPQTDGHRSFPYYRRCCRGRPGAHLDFVHVGKHRH